MKEYLKTRAYISIHPTGIGMISFVSAVEQGAESTALKEGEWIGSKIAALDGTSHTSDLD